MGLELLSFLRRPDVMAKLRDAAERGTQPAAAISAELSESFPSVIHDPAVKGKLGFFVAAVLDGEGFSVARANVRLRNPLFKSAAIFRRRAEQTTTPGNLLSRLADAVTEAEAQELVELLIDRFPRLKKRFR
jgi:hypothetical protein